MTEPMTRTKPQTYDPSDCPKCGEWRDGRAADCANCGYHEHRVDEDRDRGGAMDGTCLDCGIPVARDSYGSFVGPWRDSVSAAHDHDCKEVADAQAASPRTDL